ncbi:T9SS type A sorting domain-containing protein [uncultured Polaribacter sp.]|uniref:T9SS type A sorting domain-containing protein n=1 Tax=uncultured Polaribacter sp. TaxID=174711 RepID=UPI002603FF37|nr:T9SS type A sorting domain-containing protein [uncultured Polaribacter sp.]
MIKNITSFLFFCSFLFSYGQDTVLNDFDTTTPTVTAAFGHTFSSIANPDVTDPDNTSANVGSVGRTGTNWFSLVRFPVNFTVPAGETRYVHILVQAQQQTDIGIRVDGTISNPNAGAVIRPTNDYVDIGKWQDMVIPVVGGAGGKTVIFLSFHADMGFNNTPVGQKLNNTDNTLLIDNIKVNTTATSELQNTWLGTTADWSVTSNWSRGLPSASLGVFIPDTALDPVVADNTAIETGYLNIATGAALNIGNGSSLLVSEEANTGTINYSRTLTADVDPTKAWHLITSPLAGVSIVNFIANNTLASGTTNTNFRGIGNYINDGSGFNYYLDTYTGTDAFNVGKGFAVKNAAAGNVEFSGFFRKNDRQFSISQGTNNFNLIGNPYLSYINLGTFLTENNAVTDRLTEPTIWLWNPNKNGVGLGGYITKMLGTDAAFEVAPGQAFFVSAGPAAANVVSFSEANQSHKTDSFLKSNSNRTEIELKITQRDLINSTNLYYIEGTTTGFDSGFDGSLFTGVSDELSIYSELVSDNDGKKIAVQSLPNSDYESMVIPLGVTASSGSEINISATAANLPEGLNIYLEDRLNNTLTNLNKENFSLFIEENLNGSGRFFLRTSAKSVLSTDDTLLSSLAIFNNNNTIKIRGLQQGQGAFTLFNILGKQVLLQRFESVNNLDINVSTLTAGIYVARIQTTKGTLSKKIILE